MSAKNIQDLPNGTYVQWNGGEHTGRTCGPRRLNSKGKPGINRVEYVVEKGFFCAMSKVWKFGAFVAKTIPARNLAILETLPEGK